MDEPEHEGQPPEIPKRRAQARIAPRMAPDGMGSAFWAVWSASTISFIGNGLTVGAMPLLALSITADARLIAAVNAMMMTGWLLLGLVSGVVVDNSDRLRIMWWIDAARALIMAALTVAVISSQVSVPGLLLLALLLGLAAPFFDNASSSIIPELVPPPLLEKANSWTQVPLLLGTSLIGPPVGALMFTVSHGAPFLIDAVTFAGSALLLALLLARRGHARPSTAAHDALAGPWQMLKDGLSYLASHPTLRTLAVAVGMINTITGGVFAVLVIYTTQALHLPGHAYGWLIAAFALGGVIGSPLVPRIASRVGARAATIGSLMAFGIMSTVLGAVPWLPIAIPTLALGGFASVVWNVVTISYRQRIIPRELLGRVNSSYRVIGFAGIPVGAIGAGILTQAIGVAPTYLLGGHTRRACHHTIPPANTRAPGVSLLARCFAVGGSASGDPCATRSPSGILTRISDRTNDRKFFVEVPWEDRGCEHASWKRSVGEPLRRPSDLAALVSR